MCMCTGWIYCWEETGENNSRWAEFALNYFSFNRELIYLITVSNLRLHNKSKEYCDVMYFPENVLKGDVVSVSHQTTPFIVNVTKTIWFINTCPVSAMFLNPPTEPKGYEGGQPIVAKTPRSASSPKIRRSRGHGIRPRMKNGGWRGEERRETNAK